MLRFGLGSVVLWLVSQTSNAQWTPTILSSSGYSNVGAGGISSAGAAGYGVIDNSQHALFWRAGSTSPIDLNPQGYIYCVARFCVGDNQFGDGFGQFGDDQTYRTDALMWSGSPESFVDLHPGGAWTDSNFQAASRNSRVGIGYRGDAPEARAMLWLGTSNSVIDLTPTAAYRGLALGTTDDTQVGSVQYTHFIEHATLWHGSRESSIDLNPGRARQSIAYGAYGNRQVGYSGLFDSNNNYVEHATLWQGTSESAIDLNSDGLDESWALDMFGDFQVGSGIGSSTGNRFHAMVWQGSAENSIDLHSTLAGMSSTFTSSFLFGISENGDVIGGGADENGYHIIRWTHVVPEPSSLLALSFGALLVLRRRKKSRATT
jgi:PEP-CTERM motif